MHGLRRKAEVADNGDLRISETLDQLGAVHSAFNFDGFSAGFLHKADRVGHAVLHAHLVGAVGHICGNDGVFYGASHSAGVVEHLVYGDGEGGVIPEDDLRERIADEDEVYSGFVYQTGGGIVVGSQRSNGSAALLFFLKCLEGHLGANGRGILRIRATEVGHAHGCLQCSSRGRDATRTSPTIRLKACAHKSTPGPDLCCAMGGAATKKITGDSPAHFDG